MDSSLLAQPTLSLITRHVDTELARIHELVRHKVLVDGRSEVESVLSQLLTMAGTSAPKTLDLIGHSTPGAALLQLGDWVLDAGSLTVTAFFRGLADNEVLPRLGITAVRLLGCKTADTAYGRSTICTLSDILGVEVYGTTGLLFSAHYGANGFRDEWRFLLIGSSDIRRRSRDAETTSSTEIDPRALDVDSLVAVPLDKSVPRCTRRIANERSARSILRLVRRREGARMPGLLAMPCCEIALPSSQGGLYHLAQVVLDGEFVRVYPEGSPDGLLYPVTQPQMLRALVEQLPAVPSI